MRRTTVEQLLLQLERDQVVPVRYSRRSVPSRVAPALAMPALAVAVIATGIALGRL